MKRIVLHLLAVVLVTINLVFGVDLLPLIDVHQEQAYLMTLVSYYQNYASPKEMDVIYVSNVGLGLGTYMEHKVDLKNKKVWEYNAWASGEYVQRDPAAEEEGFDFMRELNGCKIETFRRRANWCGFANWGEPNLLLYDWYRFVHRGERYEANPIVIEDYWEITIVFADGTTKQDGSNSGTYPRTWDCMYDAFEELTGENILLYKKKRWAIA